MVDSVPGGEHAERCEETRQDHQPHRKSIHTEVIANGGIGDPGAVYFKLKARSPIDVVHGQMEREAKGDQGDDEGEPLDDAALPRQESHDDGSGSRHKRDKRQYGIVQHSSVSWALLKVHGKAEIGNQEEGACADSQPFCIGTNVSGLHTLDYCAQAADAACCDAGATVDDSAIDSAPQKIAAKDEERGHDYRVIDLVDPILVDQQCIDATETLDELIRHAWFATVNQIRKK